MNFCMRRTCPIIQCVTLAARPIATPSMKASQLFTHRGITWLLCGRYHLRSNGSARRYLSIDHFKLSPHEMKKPFKRGREANQIFYKIQSEYRKVHAGPYHNPTPSQYCIFYSSFPISSWTISTARLNLIFCSGVGCTKLSPRAHPCGPKFIHWRSSLPHAMLVSSP